MHDQTKQRPDGLLYSERKLWASCPEAHAALVRLARYRERLQSRTYVTPCGCLTYCGDDDNIDGPGTCKSLPRQPMPPLIQFITVRRDA